MINGCGNISAIAMYLLADGVPNNIVKYHCSAASSCD